MNSSNLDKTICLWLSRAGRGDRRQFPTSVWEVSCAIVKSDVSHVNRHVYSIVITYSQRASSLSVVSGTFCFLTLCARQWGRWSYSFVVVVDLVHVEYVNQPTFFVFTSYTPQLFYFMTCLSRNELKRRGKVMENWNIASLIKQTKHCCWCLSATLCFKI